MCEMFLEAVCGKRTPAAIRHPRVRSRRPLKPRAGKCAVQAQREKSRIRWFARFSLVHESTLQSWWWSTREIFLKEESREIKASKNKPRKPLPSPGTISIKLTLCLQCRMLLLSTKTCLKSSKLRPILNGQFCHAISKNICLNVLGSKQP